MIYPQVVFVTARAFLVAWSASDGAGIGVAATFVRVIHQPATGGTWSGWSLWKSTTTARLATFTGAVPGYRYCFSVRAVDRAGNYSAWSAARCTVVPLDDRSLAAATPWWTRGIAANWLMGTYTSTTHLGAVLVLGPRSFRQVGVIATRCSTCAVVGVYLGSTRIGTINLAGTATTRVLFLLPATSTLRTGKISLVVLTSGRLARIDALAIRT